MKRRVQGDGASSRPLSFHANEHCVLDFRFGFGRPHHFQIFSQMLCADEKADRPEAIRDERKRVIAGVDIPAELERPPQTARAAAAAGGARRGDIVFSHHIVAGGRGRPVRRRV
jgi:hypothetical protein